MNHIEQKILEHLKGRHLITTTELGSYLRAEQVTDGDSSVQKLKSMGYIDKVESLGTCLVITQKGLRALKEKGF